MHLSTPAKRPPFPELAVAQTAEGIVSTDSGQVAGQADTPGGQHHAFLYSGGKMIDLGTLGGGNSSADDINDSGQVVGKPIIQVVNITPFSTRAER